jgi:DoxX-like family
MPSGTHTAPASKTMLWTGRIISALMIVFMLFDAGVKILKLPAAVEGTVRLGYPASTVQLIGIIALVCALLYAIPRTSILGAILLTGYLGGATATQVRVQEAWSIFPPILGALIWAGLYLRDERLRALIPLNSPKENRP